MRNPFVESIRLVVRVAETGGFRVALIGGFALPFYGVQRATGDVDFLVEASGSAALHDALVKAGADCLHRGLDSANYAAGRSKLTGIDFIYARRARALAMLERAPTKPLRGARLAVPVLDREALIGLKLQAIANAPARRTQDRADIEALLATGRETLDLAGLRDYCRLFGKEERMSSKTGSVRRRSAEPRRRPTPLVGGRVPDQRRVRDQKPARDLDEFLALLANLEAVFGPLGKPARINRGTIFLL